MGIKGKNTVFHLTQQGVLLIVGHVATCAHLNNGDFGFDRREEFNALAQLSKCCPDRNQHNKGGGHNQPIEPQAALEHPDINPGATFDLFDVIAMVGGDGFKAFVVLAARPAEPRANGWHEDQCHGKRCRQGEQHRDRQEFHEFPDNIGPEGQRQESRKGGCR